MSKKNSRCIFCNSKNIEYKSSHFAPFLTERMFDNKEQPTKLIKCKHCGIKYSSYRPNDEEMAKLYSGYRDENYQKQRQKYEPNYTEEFNKLLGNCADRKQKLNSIFLKYLKPDSIATVLDYGGDRGQYIPDCFKNAKKYVYEISNVDTEGDIERISNKEKLKKYDLIICNQVLEHVSYPEKIIKELYDLCNDGGYIFIGVPEEPEYHRYNTIHEHINNFNALTLLNITNVIKVNIISIFLQEGLLGIIVKKEKINFFKSFFQKIFYKQKILNTKISKIMRFIRIYKYVK